MKQVTWIDKKLLLAILRLSRRPLHSFYFIDRDVNSFEIEAKQKKTENIHFDGNDVNAMVTSKQQTYLIIFVRRRADFRRTFFLLEFFFLLP